MNVEQKLSARQREAIRLLDTMAQEFFRLKAVADSQLGPGLARSRLLTSSREIASFKEYAESWCRAFAALRFKLPEHLRHVFSVLYLRPKLREYIVREAGVEVERRRVYVSSTPLEVAAKLGLRESEVVRMMIQIASILYSDLKNLRIDLRSEPVIDQPPRPEERHVEVRLPCGPKLEARLVEHLKSTISGTSPSDSARVIVRAYIPMGLNQKASVLSAIVSAVETLRDNHQLVVYSETVPDTHVSVHVTISGFEQS